MFYLLSGYVYAYVAQQCVDAYYYEESLRNCQNQSQVYGTNYFFEGDQCCAFYKDDYSEVKSCFCASDYCNNYILQPTVISQPNDTTTSSSASQLNNSTTTPRPVTMNAGNSSGNISQSTTRMPSNGTTTPRPATVNAGNSSGNISQSTTTMPSNGTTTPRPATVNAGNSSGNISQSTTTMPSNGTTTPRPATVNAGNSSGNISQSTTRMPSNGTTTPRPATVNAGNSSGNISQSTTRMPSNVTTTPRSNDTTTFSWYNPDNATESSTMSYPYNSNNTFNNSNFVSCYECWYSGNSFDTSNESSCSPQSNSRNGSVCNEVACQTYSYSYPSKQFNIVLCTGSCFVTFCYR